MLGDVRHSTLSPCRGTGSCWHPQQNFSATTRSDAHMLNHCLDWTATGSRIRTHLHPRGIWRAAEGAAAPDQRTRGLARQGQYKPRLLPLFACRPRFRVRPRIKPSYRISGSLESPCRLRAQVLPMRQTSPCRHSVVHEPYNPISRLSIVGLRPEATRHHLEGRLARQSRPMVDWIPACSGKFEQNGSPQGS